MKKKISSFIILVGLFLLLVKPVLAQEVELYFFWADGCPHCANEKIFLDKLIDKYPQLTIKDYGITKNSDNVTKFQEIGNRLHADIGGVPFTVIGNDYWIGFLSESTTGKEIEKVVQKALGQGNETLSENIQIPILGTIKTTDLSLPLLTFVVALIDGFNPCAMWALLFLISLLLGMKDKKRMWILGVTFVATSALVYFLFLAAWLNLFLFLGLVVWVRLFIGLVALGSGGYYLRDFWKNQKGGCNIMGGQKRHQFFEKIRTVTLKKQFLLALGGIVILAVAVNMVELICSAGLPAVYTKVLSLYELPKWQYYLYLAFYILIFMMDDLFVFFTAMITLQMVGIQSKYARYSHFIGGLLMLAIGGLLLFKPEWLMFG